MELIFERIEIMHKIILIIFILSHCLFGEMVSNNVAINKTRIEEIFNNYKKTFNIQKTIVELEEESISTIINNKPSFYSDSQYVSLLNDYAYFLSETDRYKEAIPILERVILLSPNRAVAYLNLGDCYYKDYQKSESNSDKDKVVENYKRYVSLLKKDAQIPDRVKKIIEYKSETYKDEKHIKINLGNDFFNLEGYHVVLYEKNNGIEKYICRNNKNNFDLLSNFDITIKPIENPKTTNIDSILAYVKNNYQTYNSVSIYLDIYGDSKITKLFVVKEDEKTNYIVAFKDSWFLLESQNAILDLMLFDTYNNYKADNTPNFVLENLTIKCSKNNKVILEKISRPNDNRIDYRFTQEKNEIEFTGMVFKNKETYNFVLKDKKGNSLLSLLTEENSPDNIVRFEDLNMDGYLDFAFLSEPNGWEGYYELFTWNNDKKKFEKVNGVKLSHFEISGEYIKNWEKSDYGYKLQTFIWKGSSLKKINEKDVKSND